MCEEDDYIVIGVRILRTSCEILVLLSDPHGLMGPYLIPWGVTAVLLTAISTRKEAKLSLISMI